MNRILHPSVRRSALWVLLGIHTALLAWSATRASPTWDEPGHLAAGLSHWTFGSFELYAVNPPLVRVVATAPVLAICSPKLDWRDRRSEPTKRSEVHVGRRIIELNGPRSIELFIAARWACIPFSLLGAWICYQWSRELYGEFPGLFAAALWCFSPMVLGYGQLITPDVGSAALGLAAFYGFRRWLQSQAWHDAALSGTCIGFAWLAKSTWLILAPLWLACWLIWRGNLWWRQSMRARLAEMAQLASIAALSLVLLNTFYTFESTGTPLGEFSFGSNALAGAPEHRDSRGFGNRFRETWLSGLPVPLPENFVLGLDLQKLDFERGFTEDAWRSYLFGQWQNGGWWYFYLAGLAVKEPLGGWLLLLLAGTLRVRNPRGLVSWREEVLLWLPALAVLVLASSQTGVHRHVRYVLPMYPFVMIWTSQVLQGVVCVRSVRAWIVGGAFGWYVASSLCQYPYSLSYFNELARGSKPGSQPLVDSNLDLGQDLLRLRDWLDARPEIRRIGLAYYGCPDPADFGIEYMLPLPSEQSPRTLRNSDPSVPGLQPGWYAISVNLLCGQLAPVPDGTGRFRYYNRPVFTYFNVFEQVDCIGSTIYLYHLEWDDVDELRRRRKLPHY